MNQYTQAILTIGRLPWVRVHVVSPPYNPSMLTAPPIDYIFFTGKGEVDSLIRPHRTEDFGAGLPKRGVCASDHVSLGCSLFFAEA
jgi:RNA exonuclease NGL2